MKASPDVQNIILEIKDVACPTGVEYSFFLCGGVTFCLLLSVVWTPEFAFAAVAPIVILWARLRGIEKWAERKVRRLDLEGKIEREISRGDLDASFKEVREIYLRLNAEMKKWVSQKPTIFERMFLEREMRSEEQNVGLFEKIQEVKYFNRSLVLEFKKQNAIPGIPVGGPKVWDEETWLLSDKVWELERRCAELEL